MSQRPWIPIVLAVAARLPLVVGHGWMTTPVSKNELANKVRFPEGGSFRYEPQSSANGNLFGQTPSTAPGSSCGATSGVYEEGPATWQQWYDASRGLGMPTLTPGSDMDVRVTITADHGGQAWLMIACDERISESANWVYLDRALGDRTHNFLASNPAIYAWATQSSGGELSYSVRVPADFSCPAGRGVGRWLWKTSNTCIDANNVGRKTETFDLDAFKSVAGSTFGVCSVAPETFISCFDFQLSPGSPTSPPSPVTLSPTPVPVPPPAVVTPSPTTPVTLRPTPTPAPPVVTPSPTVPVTLRPTPRPTSESPAPTPSPTMLEMSTTSPQASTSTGSVFTCSATPLGVSAGASDEKCQMICALLERGMWPCSEGSLCQCTSSPDSSTTTMPSSSSSSSTTVVSTTQSTTAGQQPCVANPSVSRGVSDSQCARCPEGYQWWPCNEPILCQGDCAP